jgi:mono/diheme cytochrome c family protein
MRLASEQAGAAAVALAAALTISASVEGRPPQASAPTAAAPTLTAQRAVIDRYCVTCHNSKRRTAGLALDTIQLDPITGSAEVWEKVVRRLRTGAMPPVGAPRPDKAAAHELAASLEAALDGAAAAHPNPGPRTIHRLNRTEYTNAIRDLLSLDVDGRSLLPADDSGYGFDNIADVLSVSPGLLERYMSAAARISRTAVGDPMIRPVLESYRVPKYLIQDARMGEDLPFGSRGGFAFRHTFPLDAEYDLKIRLQKNLFDIIRGLEDADEIDVRVDGVRVRQFGIGGAFKQNQYAPDLTNPAVKAAEDYMTAADKALDVRVPIKAGPHTIAVSFSEKSAAGEGFRRPPAPVSSIGLSAAGPAHVDHVDIGGPFVPSGPGETPSRRQIFVCAPTAADEDACARKIVGSLARRAFRRPVTDADVTSLLQSYRTGRAKGSFDAGIELALRRILVSPDFLFRVDRQPAGSAPGRVFRLNDIQLASRLSFFLWSSIPDEALLNSAERGELADPAVLDRHLRRMIADPRSRALVTSFASQWLYVRNMQSVAPDPVLFPDFDDNLRQAFQQETTMFLEDTLREDRSIVDLLRANYTFLNERLARHYGIPNVYGSHFRRVTFPNDQRAGLLGHGSILTVTSQPNRTSPVVRGKWLLDNVLGAPPPPPPADVPPLKENDSATAPTSVRERLEQHRKNAVCASCHARMDPLGFALENFDAVGRWRTTEANAPIDASGVLPDGEKFVGPSEFRAWLVAHREQFVTAMTEKLLTYALGRGLEYYDAPTVRAIVRGAAPEYRWSALITGIVKSMPFQMGTPQEPGGVETPAPAVQ